MSGTATAQGNAGFPGVGSDKMPVSLHGDRLTTNLDGSVSGTLALLFRPSGPEWHGYWSNPGDAGLGMTLDWNWDESWFEEPLYPVPERLVISGLMNHVYEGDYAVLVPFTIPAEVARGDLAPPRVTVDYLACTDTICVPQQARLTLDPDGWNDRRLAEWRARVAPMLDRLAGYEISRGKLRIGISLPAGLDVGDTHVFLETPPSGSGIRPDYAAVQTFIREGDLLVAELPLKRPEAIDDAGLPSRLDGIVSFGEGQGVRFSAEPRDVPLEGVTPISGATGTPALWVLLLAALGGGLLLNIMPCVFPILSLKALSLAKAGGDEMSARRDALAYTAGVVLACAGLGALILLLRSAGEQVGWAFQLQEPRVVGALFLLAVAITANFLGLFEVPGMAVAGGRSSMGGSFGTGLLAAFVATPCTGPFMALALGAALVLRPVEGLAIFTALGIGLAFPFLLLGFIPAWRRKLPKPGPWMERFRRWMAVPMGLTVLALAWLLWRIADDAWRALLAVLAAALIVALGLLGKRQGRGAPSGLAFLGIAVVAAGALAILPAVERQSRTEASSILDPQPFSEQALADARASGQPVFVWFTADWCVTCKVNEQVAIERQATRAAFENAGVVSLRGDWTRADAEISAFLARQGAAGVPLYLWYAPGGDAVQLPQVLTPDLLAERARAQGQGRSPATGPVGTRP